MVSCFASALFRDGVLPGNRVSCISFVRVGRGYQSTSTPSKPLAIMNVVKELKKLVCAEAEPAKSEKVFCIGPGSFMACRKTCQCSDETKRSRRERAGTDVVQVFLLFNIPSLLWRSRPPSLAATPSSWWPFCKEMPRHLSWEWCGKSSDRWAQRRSWCAYRTPKVSSLAT